MNTSVTFNEKQTIPHCRNNSKTNNTALSEQFKNKQYRTVGTIQNQTIPHCRNNSKTNNTALSEQFKNKQYSTVGTIQKQTIQHCLNNSKTNNTALSEQFKNQISKLQKEAKSILLTQKYMTTHFRGLI